MNEDLFPRSANIKAKLEFPLALKDDPQTIKSLHQWNDYLGEVKKKLNVKVLAQSNCTCEFLHKERFSLFPIWSPLPRAMARIIINWKEGGCPPSPTKHMVLLACTATTADCQQAMRSSNIWEKTNRPHWPRSKQNTLSRWMEAQPSMPAKSSQFPTSP
jgi:hypothetical protein